MYRMDIHGTGARKLSVLPPGLRQELLLELGKVGGLADDQGIQGFSPVLHLWMDFGAWRALFTVDLRKQVLTLIDLVEKV